MTYILIDTSYLIFYRYFAILRWWQFAMPDTELGNPCENPVFCEKFERAILDCVANIKRDLVKIGLLPKVKKEKRTKTNDKDNDKDNDKEGGEEPLAKDITVIACRDCPRREIWRNELYGEYKSTRESDDGFMGGPFFKKVYSEGLMEKAGCDHVLQYDFLEADDLVSITANYIKTREPTRKIIIIANDADYLQLWSDNCEIVNLKMNLLNEGKNSYQSPQKNLFMKIVLGDKSDNISPVFARCSKKMCEELYENPDLFAQKLHAEEGAYERLLINKTIIDFAEIPEDLSRPVIERLASIFF